MLRSGKLEISLGFLRIVVLLGIPASILLSAAALRSTRPVAATALWLAAALVWLAVAVRSYSMAGRMELGIALTLFPLALLMYLRSGKKRVAVFAAIFMLGVFIILVPSYFFPQPLSNSATVIEAIMQNTGRSVLFILNEFSFPHLITANTLHIVPESIGYRYFVDFALAPLYLLPSLGGADTWPPLTAHLHAGLFPKLMMPIDMVSFGYYNAGIIGVALIMAAFGGLLAVLDQWLRPGNGWLVQCLRAAWMLYFPFRLMYSTPYDSVKSGFGVLVGTAIIIVMVWLAKRNYGAHRYRDLNR